MSSAGVSKLKTLVLTGNPVVDAAIRYGAVALCGVLTGSITGWLNAHGFSDPNLVYYVGGAVSTTIIGILFAAWGVVRTSKNELIVKFREAIGVQAGINLAAAGQAQMVESIHGNEVPKPVTVSSAQEIIKEHATPIDLTKK